MWDSCSILLQKRKTTRNKQKNIKWLHTANLEESKCLWKPWDPKLIWKDVTHTFDALWICETTSDSLFSAATVNKGFNNILYQFVISEPWITSDELYGDNWCFFGCFSVSNQVSAASCCNSVLLWSSRTVLWTTTFHLTSYQHR